MPARTLVSFVVAADRPLLVVDIAGAPEAAGSPLSESTDPEIWSLIDRGLRVLPGFFGMPLPETGALRLRLGDGGGDVQLRTSAGVLLSSPAADVPDDWATTAREHGGVVLLVGRGTGVADAATPADAAAAAHAAAAAGRVAGAVVDLA